MRIFAYYTLGIVGWSASAIGAILGFSSHYPAPGRHAIIDPIVVILLGFTWQTSIWVALGAACFGIQKQMRQPWIKPAIKKMLDAMRQDAFASNSKLEHHHRVTLFRVRRFCWKAMFDLRWPFGLWLIPFSRSGPAEKMNAYFCVPTDLDQAEGVAGMAYATDSAVPVEGLPNVSGKSPKQQDLETYARKAHVGVEWLKKRNRNLGRYLDFRSK